MLILNSILFILLNISSANEPNFKNMDFCNQVLVGKSYGDTLNKKSKARILGEDYAVENAWGAIIQIDWNGKRYAVPVDNCPFNMLEKKKCDKKGGRFIAPKFCHYCFLKRGPIRSCLSYE